MAWKQLVVKTHLQDTAYAEDISEFLSECGALSTTFSDNEDDPIFEPELNKVELWANTNITCLFDIDVDLDIIVNMLKEHLKVEVLDYEIQVVEDQDWVRVCLDQFHPMKFGEKLWICPSNQTVEDPEAVIVDLDPGLAFGTGSHPTTRMCLQYLDALAQTEQLQDKVVIDYGCGSGILAIAALKLGAKVAYGVDIDPQAIEATIANAKNNQVAERLETYLVEDFAHQEEQADILVANILAGPLVELAPALSKLVKPQGLIALSGILDIKAQDIVAAYSDAFEILSIEYDEEWVRVTGKKK
ncbi:50S ribosomal protein L11 methyltransferase [Psittacicella hinzii]|uniref:Ribosomal protein L11 methyltransferase n=1 Tax=Psittacicella hinzii TaxID=2028575 RepID=A0A3A1YAP4_9GAMM|nr:50S ribosomal protein L11 methyltransferase [Psittacicella hinzii]RIY34745.1 50S ribosomal protein L11 methyltransferase [Psittacicella hinzii]